MLFFRRNGATTPSEFQAFRSFVVTQSSKNVGNACIFTALSMFFSFFKTVSSAGATPMLVFVAALPVCAYAAASVAMKCKPAGQEVGGHWFGSSRSGDRKLAGYAMSSLPGSDSLLSEAS
ncbi:hypothetical protein DUNSADRAFT_17213 [Dunaliella salina]|uniref:Encoded protein n=1 Tax=Dunaliella salina TaxID=3046 RepID=A0ABQ7G265_DUNSA|nr:hypothetical protein DUNSADRAFT_17213 [Dunaliella salina]|eukprot:KAF5828689.1 hypothetical protein DUNSADRAFT_17213 [Dunaliella salina]